LSLLARIFVTVSDCTKPMVAPKSCFEKLQAAIARYDDLMVGDAEITSVRNGDEAVTFGAAKYNLRSIESLKEYIAALNKQCPCASANEVLGIPMNRNPAYLGYSNMHMESRMGCRRCG
jgi:gpW